MGGGETYDAIRALPCWTGSVGIAPLQGGITNRNYRVIDSERRSYVVRIGRDIPEHGVMRFNELAAARAAHAAGISPEVVHAGEGLLVSRYVEGRTLAPEDVRDVATLDRVAAIVRRCHQEIPRHLRGPALVFWVFQVVRNYLGFLREHAAVAGDVPLEALAERNARLERAVGPVDIVFGHNDLLAANLIDDGERLWLIDWDYAGFNSPLFDLANVASNNGLAPGLEERLLRQYYGTTPDAAVRRGFLAMQCASLLREGLWGAVSRHTSRIDFDYGAYAADYLRRFEQRWRQFEVAHG